MNDSPINARTPIADSNGMVNKFWFLFFTEVRSKISMWTGKTSSSAAAGTASVLPSAPEGYTVVNINGTEYKVPYYK
jgi:hypothetical protein